MAKEIKVDWAPIATEYSAGATSDELAAKYNVKSSTIRQRASRKGWGKRAVNASVERSKESGEPPKPVDTSKRRGGAITKQDDITKQLALGVANQFQRQKEEFLSLGGKVAVTGMRRVTEAMEDETNIYIVGQLGEIAESFTRVAKPIFGLDASNVSVNVATQVNVLSDLPPETLDWDAKATD